MKDDEISKSDFESKWANVCAYPCPYKCAFQYYNAFTETLSLSTICHKPCPVRGEKIYYELQSYVDMKRSSAITNYSNEIHCPGLSAYSVDKQYLAKVIKIIADNNNGYLIEIWSKNRLFHSISLVNTSIHGDIYFEESFASIVWSSNNDKIYYIAEKYRPKLEKNDLKFYEFKENFGEKLSSIHYPDIFCLDIPTGSVSPIFDIPSHLYPNKLFVKDNDLYFLAYNIEGVPQGVLYCTNQPNELYVIKKFTSLENLTEKGRCVVSCTVNIKFPVIAILERCVGGPHMSAIDLILINSSSFEKSKIFESIYATTFIPDCWLNFQDNFGIILEIFDGYRNTSIVNLALQQNGNWNLFELNINDDYNYQMFALFCYPGIDDATNETYLCACSKSNLISPWSIILLKFTITITTSSPVFVVSEINLFVPDRSDQLGLAAPSIKTFFFDTNRQITTKADCAFSGILVYPNKLAKNNHPLIVISHGGPHSIITLEYKRLIYLFIKCGFVIYIPNYRGSLGFNEEILQSLLGNIGHQDVEDVHLSLLAVIEKEKIETKNIHCFGGSHGGFISAHLIGQYKDFYTSCVLRNPVIDLISMYSGSDIPEWVFTETGMDYSSKQGLKPEQLAKLYKSSPIFYGDSILCPVLLLLGSEDKRVPMQQGMLLYRTLKSRKSNVYVHVYKDCHALDSVDTERSCAYEITHFLLKHTQ